MNKAHVSLANEFLANPSFENILKFYDHNSIRKNKNFLSSSMHLMAVIKHLHLVSSEEKNVKNSILFLENIMKYFTMPEDLRST